MIDWEPDAEMDCPGCDCCTDSECGWTPRRRSTCGAAFCPCSDLYTSEED